ncbi:MAG: hypothetical protein L6V91_00665 [Bacilli bacterium]|nr:MAG: hypothetical protein L6V91_00665 [Bacilli bacterium]
MPLNAWNRLYKLWNRQAVVMNFGVYIYQLDDTIQSITPRLNTIFGRDKALKETIDYYKKKTNMKKRQMNIPIFF